MAFGRTSQLVGMGLSLALAGCAQMGTAMLIASVVPSKPKRTAQVYTIQTVTDREIEAAAAMGFDDSRRSALEAIARRPGLSPAEQVHLVYVIYQRMDFENNKKELLLTVIDNPDFCNAAKSAILENMGRCLGFENTKAQILQALDERGALPA